ncbi:MAG: DUF1858 domain-containing protein [Oscillospiraceae bacterium]|nr:DUF1858 domain-containing protein [Oscillospiraceae bacterium]
MDFKVTKDMIIGDILDKCPQAAPCLMDMGMHCLGCPSARGESLGDACMVHGVDPDEFEKKINEFIAAL